MAINLEGGAIGLAICGAGAFLADRVHAAIVAVPETASMLMQAPPPDPTQWGAPSAGVWFGLGGLVTAIGTAIIQPWLKEKGTAAKLDDALKQIAANTQRLDQSETEKRVLNDSLARAMNDSAKATERMVRLAGDLLAQTGRIKPIGDLDLPLGDSPPDLDGPKVLIVEDSEYARDALADILTLKRCRTTKVGGVQAALNAIGLDTPDVVILDLMLPDGDGVEVLRTIKTNGSATRVVVTTGKSLGELVEVRKLNPTAILTKPVDVFKDLWPYLETAAKH